MGYMLPNNSMYIPSVVSRLDTSLSAESGWGGISVLRASTDAYFYADVTIHNAIVGSRYWLVNDDDHSQVLATGVISSDLEVLSDIPSYGSPMIMFLRLRKASSSPYYETWEGKIPHVRSGSDFYVSQKLDE